MAADVTVKLNRSGVRALMNSRGVTRDLARRAKAIADRAGTEPDEDGTPAHVMAVSNGRTRARAVVITATAKAMELEATTHNLSSALDAGRSA